MRKTVILLIIPEFKTEDDITRWNNNLEWAYSNYDKYPLDESTEISVDKRWAIGYVAWKKLIECFHMINTVDVYFIRTDFRLNEYQYSVENNILTVNFNFNYGHIIYKTLIGIKLFNNQYDYIIRGNINTIIDINYINKLAQDLPLDGVFSSPFWEGGSYPYGYFMIISKDIANYLSQIDLKNSTNRWFNEDTADDYELTNVILKKFQYYVIPGCDRPWISTSHPKQPISNVNKHGIIFNSNPMSTNILTNIKQSNDSVFLYRIRNINDNKYFTVYKCLIKHIWNKFVREKFKDLLFYNEANHLVPHLEYERDEQLLVAQYIDKDDIVLELGARYGSVSCIINRILENKLNQVSVEPDNTVWSALEKNKKINNCLFQIYKGIISRNKYKLKINGYGSTVDITNTITDMKSINTDNITLEELQKQTGLVFNVLVADCEGFLEVFLDENLFLYTQLTKIIFECDRADVCNYERVKNELVKNGFKLVENGFQCVYKK
jgi:FkbM family methyltransferase